MGDRRAILLSCAAAAFLAGWVLPVVDDYRGWQAFRVGLSPIWPYERFGFGSWYAVLTVASSLTNVLFVVLFALLAVRARIGPRSAAWALAAATIVNLHWLVRAGAEFTELALGYYVWLLAFPLLALAVRER